MLALMSPSSPSSRSPLSRVRSSRVGLISLVALVGLGAGLGALPACGSDDPAVTPTPSADASASADTSTPPPGEFLASGPSRGSPVALSWDDATLVVANRDTGTVSVVAATYSTDGTPPTLTKKVEIPVGAEPWQVAIAPDNSTAFAVLRADQKLVRIGGIGGATPAVTGSVATGSEPTAVALSPTGKTVWVANWVDGTVVAYDAATLTVKRTVDLNATLIATGLLGTGLTSRPGLAHPRSIAITNNGNADDSDESLYVTEYFGQRTAPEVVKAGGNPAEMDTNHDGIVYKINASDGSASTIRLGAIGDIGFKDSAGQTAGCFPNQLQSITIQGTLAFVSSVCASPRGPTGGGVENFKTTTHGAVSVIDLATGAEVKAGTSSLHQKFDALFTTRATAETAKRYPAIPADVAFVKGGTVAYVAANAADAVFRAKYAAAGTVDEVGTANALFIDTNPAGIDAARGGKNPIGIAAANTEGNKRFLFVANDVSRTVQVVDLNTQALAGGATPVAVGTAALPAAGSKEETILKGKRFFTTGTGRWSLNGQGWGACQSCHVDGLTDNVSWSFARGPRQSTSLDGSFSKKDPNDQRIFNWTGIFDEVADFENNTRGISGGVGAIVSKNAAPIGNTDRIDIATAPHNHTGLNGSAAQAADPSNPAGLPAASVLKDWEEITTYLKTIRPPKAATGLDPAKVALGKTLFANDGGCQGCHGGDKWTISKRFYTPAIATMNALRDKTWTGPPGFPAALLPTASGTGSMRLSPTSLPDPTTIGNFDQILCALRNVGTFNVADSVSGISEFRQNSTEAAPVPAQGNQAFGRGFNSPSLLGVSVGAPYLHAGNAATLESLFAPTFKAHYTALAPNGLADGDAAARAKNLEALVQYLLSIDAATQTVAIPAAGPLGGDFCSP